MSYIFLCKILRLLKVSYLTQCLCGQSHFIPMFWQITLLAISCLFEALLLESKSSNKLLTFFNTSNNQRIWIPSNRQYIGHLFTTTMCPSSQIPKHELKAILTLCLFCLHEAILTCLLLGHAFFFFICHLYFSQKNIFKGCIHVWRCPNFSYEAGTSKNSLNLIVLRCADRENVGFDAIFCFVWIDPVFTKELIIDQVKISFYCLILCSWYDTWTQPTKTKGTGGKSSSLCGIGTMLFNRQRM